jgi:polar amino acid transport system substrate-binding protein
MDSLVLQQLAPHGVLRAGINLANFLLVGPADAQGKRTGLGPDFARMIASRLGVSFACVPFVSPRELADAVNRDVWDICLIGAEPDRAQTIAFTSALVSAQVFDRTGVSIATAAGSAYELWLTRHLRHAQLLRMPTHEHAYEAFAQGKVDALAGLRPRLLLDEATLAGVRLLDGCFTSVQQAVGTHRQHGAGAAFLERFVEEAKASGTIDELIERHRVRGVRTAPLLSSSSR